MDGSDINHALAVFGTEFIIAYQPFVASQPSKCPLDDPAARLHLKASSVIGTLDDFKDDAKFLLCPVNEGTGVLPVCPNLRQTWEAVFAPGQKVFGSLAVVVVGGRDKDAQYPSVGVYKEMPLASFDLFVRVITNIVFALAPPVSVVLTDWLSRTAAEGGGSLPTRLRSASRRAVWMFSHSPFWLHKEKYLWQSSHGGKSCGISDQTHPARVT